MEVSITGISLLLASNVVLVWKMETMLGPLASIALIAMFALAVLIVFWMPFALIAFTSL